MLKQGIIEPGSCESGFHIVFAPKKDDTLPFCVDYQELNAINIKEVYMLGRLSIHSAILGIGDTKDGKLYRYPF